MSNQQLQIGENLMSLHRPAWVQADLRAFNHCFRVKRIDYNFFVRTKGFAKKEDLALLNSIQTKKSAQLLQPKLKN